MLSEGGVGNLHPAGKPDRDSLRLVAKIWARRATGILQGPAGRAVIVQGDPKDQASLGVIVAALYQPDLRFQARDLYSGSARPLAPELWEAAGRRANYAGTRERLNHALVERPGAGGIGRLPLCDDTRTVLAQENSPRHTLADLIASAKANEGAVCSDVAVLLALGLHKLRRAAAGGSARPIRQAPPPQPPIRTSSKARQAERALQRLSREWSAIQNADDYTVVGVSRQMPMEVIQRASDRMLGRYSKLASDPRLPPEAQQIAQSIHERVSDAVVRLRQGRGTSHRGSATADPFVAGMSFVQQRDWTSAVKCFNMARHRDSNNAVCIAWLGWAVFNDPMLPTEKRRRKGKDLIDLALSLDAGTSAVIRLAAKLDVAQGDLVRAWNRLDTLVTRDPDDVEARTMLVKVQKDVKQRK